MVKGLIISGLHADPVFMIINFCSLFSVIGPKTVLKNENLKLVIASSSAGNAMDLQVKFAGSSVKKIRTLPGQQQEIPMKVIILDII